MLKLLMYLDRIIDVVQVQEVLLKLGVNFITAGIVGVFINHIAGTDAPTMQSVAVLISFIGLACILLGLLKKGKRQ